ncbi:hypothetical protein BD779DRAFT_1787674 [Infundibulicybe gibba]|nr:hypothetical protein BD779DRAFT_1787674 [Infundibulicybe gibba]
MSDIVDELLERTREDQAKGSSTGPLIMCRSGDLRIISHEEIMAQMVHYQNPAMIRSSQPNYTPCIQLVLWLSQFASAVMHEVLQLHPPVGETTRAAAEDNVIPFGVHPGARVGSDEAGVTGARESGESGTYSRFQVGRGTEFKVEPDWALTVTLGRAAGAIRNYIFELPDGPGIVIEGHRSILPRPKVVGQDGAKVPLSVCRAD